MPSQRANKERERMVGIRWTTGQFAQAHGMAVRRAREQLSALVQWGAIERGVEPSNPFSSHMYYTCKAENVTPMLQVMFEGGDGIAEYTAPGEYFLWPSKNLSDWAGYKIRRAAAAAGGK